MVAKWSGLARSVVVARGTRPFSTVPLHEIGKEGKPTNLFSPVNQALHIALDTDPRLSMKRQSSDIGVETCSIVEDDNFLPNYCQLSYFSEEDIKRDLRNLNCGGFLDSEDRISCELIDLRTFIPWDKDTVESPVNKTGRLIVSHEAPVTGGFGAEISASIVECCFLRPEAPVSRICGLGTPFSFVYEPLQSSDEP